MAQDGTTTGCTDLTVPVAVRDHVKGSLGAPVVLVEYGDYECPDCLNAWPIVKSVRKQVGEKLAFVFRHFPQNSIHPHASVAAQAAEAAGAQGKFWPMHDLLFKHQKDLATIDFTYLALQLGIEVYRFQASIELESHLRHIADDQAGGVASGVRGTPTFFINSCRYKGRVDT
ncbi:MAG TPA: DsbA family protein, partial [Tepidisphaeraceae bacterium]|nr:DsbA family protein [Tepidisphaeraceae bacterium]